jgi:glycolate oxidase FAD binding subunit
MDDSLLIDDFRPLAQIRPGSVEEAGECVRRADAAGLGVYPIGGGTMLQLGSTPVKPGHALDLRALDRLIDYPARDMTVTVQAGITIARLQSILAAENQRLPVDIPRPETSTLGGAIAVNASGPRRHGFGTLRDYVIGISFLTDGGIEARAGGRVVKNVAGYDLCKLHIGALGTLGIVTQATLKLKPLAEDSRLVEIRCRIGEAAALLEQVHGSQTRPACVELQSAAAGECRLIVGFEDNTEAVQWQIEQLRRELTRPDAPILDSGEWQRLTESLNPSEAVLSFKANLVPSALGPFLAGIAEFPELSWQAQAGNGIVTGHAGAGLTLERALPLLAQLRQLAGAGQGNVVVLRCPPAWKRELNIWGTPRGDLALMRRVKLALDPRDLFNPGRCLV